MSEDFLARWSRRKQAAAQPAEPAKPPPEAESAAAPESRDATDTAPSAPVFDPSSLPAIESITAETDIRAFLAAGVPAELTRAALRRMWTSDPKIRDFVGLADYDWDFNQPGSMAGFGPLEGADALRAQAARWVGPVRAGNHPDQASENVPGAEQAAAAASVPDRDRFNQPSQIVSADESPPKIGASPEGDELTGPAPEHTAVQQQQQKREGVQSIARRRHGGALPES
jgi:hypothetical protein